MGPLEDILAKREVERTKDNEDPVIQRALITINQPLNPIETVDYNGAMQLYKGVGLPTNIPDKRRNLNGFRLTEEDPIIYINTDSDHYRKAKRENDKIANLRLASTLVHEQIHNTERGNVGEQAARFKQADWLKEQAKHLNRYQRAILEEYIKQLERW